MLCITGRIQKLHTDVIQSGGALAAASSTEYCSHPQQRQVIIKYYIVQLKWSCYIPFHSTEDDMSDCTTWTLSPADDCLWPCQPPPSSAHPRRCPINKNTFCKEVERVNPREEFLSAKRRQRASLIVSQFTALKGRRLDLVAQSHLIVGLTQFPSHSFRAAAALSNPEQHDNRQGTTTTPRKGSTWYETTGQRLKEGR